MIIIIGILAGVGIKYMGHLHHRQCITQLKNQLSHTQNALSAYYTRAFTRQDSINPQEAREILQDLARSSNPHCHFSLESRTMTAHINTQSLTFTLEPYDLAINPIIKCNLALPLCKEFSDRILDK